MLLGRTQSLSSNLQGKCERLCRTAKRKMLKLSVPLLSMWPDKEGVGFLVGQWRRRGKSVGAAASNAQSVMDLGGKE